MKTFGMILVLTPIVVPFLLAVSVNLISFGW